jgi:tetratricopeptide (TPR) repeat protein
VRKRYPQEWNLPATTLTAASFWFLLVLRSGSTYAGVRHALPVVALLAILGGMSIATAFQSKGKALRGFVALSLLAAAASALPVLRPWEYFNEIVGGADKGYLSFDDEGVDLGQRGQELARYYHQVIQPTGEVPFISYGVPSAERRARGLDWLGADLKRDESQMSAGTFSGTVLISARSLSRKLWWDMPLLRAATPVARFGNLLVFRGTFDMRARVARDLYRLGASKVFAGKPDLDTAARMLRESVAADPSAFFVYIELGNVYLQRGSRNDAEQAYISALEHAPPDPSVRHSLESQIGLLRTQPLQQIAPLRDPGLE